jgi:hypothetical protein
MEPQKSTVHTTILEIKCCLKRPHEFRYVTLLCCLLSDSATRDSQNDKIALVR